MTRILWDQTGQKQYETGVDRGVLYLATNGVYDQGFGWNGLVTVTESPSGAEASAQYADNIKYLNLVSAEEFGATIEAFYYPPEFERCDGTATPAAGVSVGQQNRLPFGFSYRTLLGDDLSNTDAGYKIHLVYGALAAPSEKAYSTVNDSPEAITFSWEVTTTPVPVTGLKPTAKVTVNSKLISAASLTALENILYGTAGADPRLPLPDEVVALCAGSVTSATPTSPTFVSSTGVITIPTVTGVDYRRADTNAIVSGNVTISGGVGASLIIRATPKAGYAFPANVDDDWMFTRTA